MSLSSCSSPLYRVDVNSPGLPAFAKAKSKNGGFIFGAGILDVMIQCVGERAIQVLRCGQCMACRLHYSKQWAIRCMLEAEQWQHNYFITLTYADPFLPRGDFMCLREGIVKNSNLKRDDFQKFMKRFRSKCKREFDHDNVRVFYCGEYGDLYDRPHYHAILFNCPDLSSTFTFKSRSGNVVHYDSTFLQDAWCDPDSKISLGFSSISDVTFDTCAYTARYITKKINGEQKKHILKLADQLSDEGIEIRSNPFVGMSLKPGLARDYYEKNTLEIYLNDEVPYHKDFKTFWSKPPRYFDKLFDIDFPEASSELKESRIDAALASKQGKALLYSEDDELRSIREKKMLERRECRRHNDNINFS